MLRDGGDAPHLIALSNLYLSEIEAVLDQVVDETLNEFPIHHSCRSLLIAHTLKALDCDSGWVEPYVVTGELRVPELSEDGLPKEVISRIREACYPTALREERLLLFRRYWQRADPLTQVTLHGEKSAFKSTYHLWRLVPIIHPSVLLHLTRVVVLQILAAVRFHVLATPVLADSDQLPPLYAGQPIQALLSIMTSFHWGTRQDANHTSYQMRFDIEEMVRDWLISGQKRGDFEAKVCKIFV